MAIKLLSQYTLGDMEARYLLDEESGLAGFMLLPYGTKLVEKENKDVKLESLVQLKIIGDIYNSTYAMGASMRNSETVQGMKYKEQKSSDTEDEIMIDTILCDDRGYQVIHHLRWKKGMPYVNIYCTFENLGNKHCTLEMFESFSLGELSPYLEGDGSECLYLHRIRSVWSQEGRHEILPIEDLQLEPAWDPHAVRCERFGQVGSMPVNKFFPFAAVEDRKEHIYWGAQIAHNASWQMELYRLDDGLSFSGGLADREFGHWLKDIAPGEIFSTPYAIVTTAHTDSFDILSGRLVKAAEESFVNLPVSEQKLPIIFNEYCTTWGDPSHENIVKILENIKGKGFQYFVIDCGWYREKNVPWDIGMGDYEVSKELFPDGLDKTTKTIKDAGMIPGIWFEIETTGKAAHAYKQEEHLLHKDGYVLTSYARRFWNMKDPWVEDYLTKKVIGTLQDYGFGYMKIDYNETIGIGCDGAESLGEGLRQNMEATSDFIEKIKKEIPEIVLENCASGGHRLEPGLMSQMSMASFSDAHECPEIPIIAANLHWVIHPAQSQIWSVIRSKDSLKRVAYSVAATFLGRMCISGDVTELSAEQWKIIEAGICFYKKIVPIIKKGQSYQYRSLSKSIRHPRGWQAVVRVGTDEKEAYAVIHTFDGKLPECIEITLPENCPCRTADIYTDTEEQVTINDGKLVYYPKECFKAIAVRLTC